MNISASMWRTIINKKFQIVSPYTLDKTRHLYEALSEHIGEMAHEMSELWDEVQHLRNRAKMAADCIDRARIKISELERYKDRTQGLVTPKTGYSFRSYDNVQCRAVPETTLTDMENKLVELQKQLAKKPNGFQLELESGFMSEPRTITAKVYECKSIGEGGARTNTVLAEKSFTLAPEAPVTYGVDFGKDAGDSTVVTVRQGSKVLHVIDLEAERNKESAKKYYGSDFVAPFGRRINWRPLSRYCGDWKFQFQQYNFAAAEARVLAAGVKEKEETPNFNIDRYTPRLRAAHRSYVREIIDWQSKRCVIPAHGAKWFPWEDNMLKSRYLSGMPLRNMASFHGREWEAILCRLQRLAGRKVESAVTPDALNLMWVYFFRISGLALPERIRKIAMGAAAK